jgi:hypothetical protein
LALKPTVLLHHRYGETATPDRRRGASLQMRPAMTAQRCCFGAYNNWIWIIRKDDSENSKSSRRYGKRPCQSLFRSTSVTIHSNKLDMSFSSYYHCEQDGSILGAPGFGIGLCRSIVHACIPALLFFRIILRFLVSCWLYDTTSAWASSGVQIVHSLVSGFMFRTLPIYLVRHV